MGAPPPRLQTQSCGGKLPPLAATALPVPAPLRTSLTTCTPDHNEYAQHHIGAVGEHGLQAPGQEQADEAFLFSDPVKVRYG